MIEKLRLSKETYQTIVDVVTPVIQYGVYSKNHAIAFYAYTVISLSFLSFSSSLLSLSSLLLFLFSKISIFLSPVIQYDVYSKNHAIVFYAKTVISLSFLSLSLSLKPLSSLSSLSLSSHLFSF